MVAHFSQIPVNFYTNFTMFYGMKVNKFIWIVYRHPKILITSIYYLSQKPYNICDKYLQYHFWCLEYHLQCHFDCLQYHFEILQGHLQRLLYSNVYFFCDSIIFLLFGIKSFTHSHFLRNFDKFM